MGRCPGWHRRPNPVGRGPVPLKGLSGRPCAARHTRFDAGPVVPMPRGDSEQLESPLDASPLVAPCSRFGRADEASPPRDAKASDAGAVPRIESGSRPGDGPPSGHGGHAPRGTGSMVEIRLDRSRRIHPHRAADIGVRRKSWGCPCTRTNRTSASLIPVSGQMAFV